MKKIIFITSRNIINTSGELRLIKNRGEALYNDFNINTEYFALTSKKRLNRPQESMGRGSKTNIYVFSNYFTLTKQSNILFKEVVSKINQQEIIIIISGFLPNFLIKKLAKLNVKKYMDIHGTLEELKEYQKSSFIGKIKDLIRYYIFSMGEKRAVAIVDGILVVSESLKDYYAKLFGFSKEHIFVVPCGGNIKSISLQNYNEKRQIWRKEFGLDDEILFIYSGGISPWQSIEEMIEVYNNIKAKISKKSKLLIMSGNISSIKKYESKENDIFVRSFSADEVEDVLYSGDIAMLLRNDTVTNNVAFPNKYYEYLLSGMYIICSKFIYDQARITSDYNVGCLYEGVVTEKFIEQLNNIKPLDKRKDKIDLLLKELSFGHTLKKFMGEIVK